MTVENEDSDEELFSPKNSQSLEVRFKMVNSTAGTSVTDEKKIKLIQLLEKGLMIEAPARSCAVGHNISLDIRCIGTEPLKIDFHITGRVESLKSFPDENTDEITLKLLQYPEAPWDALNKVFVDRQKEIIEFLSAAGGRS